MCDEDHRLAKANHTILQQCLEELVVVTPSLHCVGAANNVLALEHVHQECQRVHNDAIWWVGVFRIHSPVKSLNHFPGISDTEVLKLVAEGQFLTSFRVHVEPVLLVTDIAQRSRFTCCG